MFLDASAIVCILTAETEAYDLAIKLQAAETRLTSGLAAYEATLAVARKQSLGVEAAMALVEKFLNGFDIVVVPIGREEYRAAARAHDRFGKGRHPARLNMGDCFAYACARTHAVPLLFKGEDFGLTDVVGA